MRSFNNRSPVLALQPQSPAQLPFNMNSNRPIFSSPFSNPTYQSPTSSSWSTLTPTGIVPNSAAGRKRSRDEAAPNLEDDYFPVQQPASIPTPPENEDDWVYGEGMVLIKPGGNGYISPESQSGTWLEEKVEEKTQSAPVAPLSERPFMRSAKSQRLDFGSTPSILEERIMSNGTPVAASPTSGYTEPTIDDYTRHLGIGWSRISADEDIQAASRGWTRYINNHYPVTDAKIRLQSKGLCSYLVEANEGFFLFGEDLKQGQLVSTTLDKTFANLAGPTPVFDGTTVMEAGQTPKVDDGPQLMANNTEVAMNGAERSITHISTDKLAPSLEVEMDMS